MMNTFHESQSMSNLHAVIEDSYALVQGYIHRQGFMFSATEPSNVFDAIVIRHPSNSKSNIVRQYGHMAYSIDEHIEFINKYQIEKAIIIAEDISFLRKCPSLKYLSVYIADWVIDKFDFSPLYDMPEIRSLNCHTDWEGPNGPCLTTVDCSRIHGLRELAVYGKGYLNYEKVDSMEGLFFSASRTHKNLKGISNSRKLKKLWFLQGGLETLEGIEEYPNLQWLALDHLRSLRGISHLSGAASSLRVLSIENCPKIQDFGCLHDLVNLEHLELMGGNALPSLDFLKNMKKLKTFMFSMDVLDCDLTPCLQIPCVYSEKNRKKYNLKDKDLPKDTTPEPFEFI